MKEDKEEDDRGGKKKNSNNSDANKTRELALRVAADAFLFGPFCNAVALSFIALALERKPAASLPSTLRSLLPGTQLRALRFWPVVSAVAYSKVPPRLRVLFFNCAGFLWGVTLISGAAGGQGKRERRRRKKKLR